MADIKLIQDRLESARRDLLDLTSRNRLISTSRSSTRSGRLEIVDELSEQVFRIVVQDTKAMTLLTAIHVAEEVCSPVAHRQVVLTIPKRLRVHTRFDRKLLVELSSCA